MCKRFGLSFVFAMRFTKFAIFVLSLSSAQLDRSYIESELKKLEESEKAIMESINASIDAKNPQPFDNKEVIPDLGSGTEEAKNTNFDEQPKNLNQRGHEAEDEIQDEKQSEGKSSATTQKIEPAASGFKELGSVTGTATSANGSNLESNKVTNYQDLNQSERSLSSSEPKTSDSDASANRQILEKELSSLKIALNSKEDEIKRLKLSEISLKSKVKLYEEELRRLNAYVDDLMKKNILNKCTDKISDDETPSNLSFPTIHDADEPVPLIEVPQGTVVYAGPSSSATRLFEISQTTRVPKIDSHNNWVRIIAPNGVKGWIKRQSQVPQIAEEKRALDNLVLVGRE